MHRLEYYTLLAPPTGVRGSLQSCRYENFFHFALAHLFLYGLLKDFLLVWCEGKQPKNRSDIRAVQENGKWVSRALYAWPVHIKRHLLARMWQIIPTRLFSLKGASATRCARNARYRLMPPSSVRVHMCEHWPCGKVRLNIVCSRGGWRMEDCMTFVDVFAPFLFFRLPWTTADRDTMKMFNRQWASLRLAIVAVLRPITTKSRSLSAQVAEYRRHIQDYADAAYQVSFS